MCYRTLGQLCAWSIVWALLSPSELCAQYHWNRTTQSSWARSTTDAFGFLAGASDLDFPTPNQSGPTDDDLAASVCTAGVNIDDGESYGSATALAEGSCELNSDGQSVLSWSFIHMANVDVEATGTACMTADGYQDTSVNTSATLAEDVSTEGTVGHLSVDIGWIASLSDYGNGKTLNITITFGDAWLNIYSDNNGGSGYLVAQGVDGYGNWFSKTSSALLTATSGSLSIGGSEFTSPLQAGDGASIQCNTPVNLSVSRSEQIEHTAKAAEIFQGVIMITAGN